jgi:hypothetical protein
MTLTPEEKAERARQRKTDGEFSRECNWCWMCAFLGRQQFSPTERHHIAGRGRRHDVRANYAALCSQCHRALQSLEAAEIVCLALKRRYDPEHYDRDLICDLRGCAATWITEGDVDRCRRIMGMMKEVAR